MYPKLFQIGNIPVYSYGTMVVIGFLLCLWRAMRVCARRMETEPEGSPRRIRPDDIFDLGMMGLLVGLVGARLAFILLSENKNWLEALRHWQSGLSLHGGMFAGILFLIWFCRRRKLSFFAVGDLAAVSFPLAYAFGRIGCFLNGCCYGGECALPWGVRFPDEQHPGALTPPSHPVQLYAMIINLVIFFLLTRWERKPHRDGEIFFAYIGLYGVYRSIMECFRAGVTSTYLVPALHLTQTHVVSFAMIAVGLFGIAYLRRHQPAVQDAAFRSDLAENLPPTQKKVMAGE
jgi:phosphatidylglycerol---prolipoprotein diacylglyceryl transferase